jgi:hypothetical protein
LQQTEDPSVEPLSLPIPYKSRIDPELAVVIEAWDRLPETIRAGIAVMVKAASEQSSARPKVHTRKAGR